MSGTGGWVPPESMEPPAPRPSTPVAHTSVGPQLNPVSVQPSPAHVPARHPVNAQPWSRSRKWTLGVGIAAAVLGIFAAIGAAGAGLYTAIIAPLTSYVEPLPLLEGEPGDPRPLEATECDDPCFGPEHLWEARLDALAFQQLGTPVVDDPAGTYADSTAPDVNSFGLDYWDASGFTPDSCLFTATEAPAVVSRDGDDGLGGSIHWLTSFVSENRTSSAVRAVRFFPTAEAAQTHMTKLAQAVPGCSAYASDGIAGVRPTIVSAMPALGAPPTVAAVGWVETTERSGRYFAVDLVRSNAVVRLTVWTNGEIDERAFRELANRAARDLAGWPLVINPGSRADEPVPGFVPDSTGATGPRDDCTGDCFSVEQAQSLAPTDGELTAIGLQRTGNAEPQGDSAGVALGARQVVETSNAQCRFALGIEPVVRGNPSAGSAAETDPLVDLGRFSGNGTSVSVVARVFENPERASAYAAAAEYALSLCSRQVVETRRGSGDVTTLPATITGYNSIDDPIVNDRETTHVGWQNAGALTDRGHDLQHGNIVVRVVIDGAPLSEGEVAQLMLAMIDRLEALEP